MFCISILLINLFMSMTLAGRSVGRHGGSHYPPSHGLSGSNSYPRHSYPKSNGMSGNNYSPRHFSYHRTEIHHHYNNYAPPPHISYGSVQHPVYQGTPPVYVYEYRNSGSRFDTLLTGLALYNLGRMSSNHHHDYNSYRSNPGEICKMVISKTNGEYEETRINCKLMSSFVWDAENENKMSNTVTKTISVQNITKDGNSTVIAVQNTTIVDALDVKGPSIQVTKGMNCYMIRTSRDSSMIKRKVDCALLQEYAQRSLRYNQCGRLTSVLSLLLLQILINYYFR